jgi:hypothetical protein
MFRKNMQATNPQDKVFPFVRVSNDGDHLASQADYSKDVNNVYMEVAMHLLTYTDHQSPEERCLLVFKSQSFQFGMRVG